ncbi:MAG: alpha/beta fold hydrolase [Rhizobiales bacterium]|nr:alpha/beta fold hydrolase [Hyphomicrobiales bacterium]
MPWAKRQDCELFWERQGEGPALILGAGLGGVGGYWQPNLSALTEHFTVYRFDQRGTGQSSRMPVASIEQMAADLVAMMDDAGLATAMYLGHSTGAAIGVAAALDAPGRFSALMIYASTTCGDNYRRKVLGLRNAIFEGLGIEAYAQYSTLLLYPPYWINSHAEEVARIEATTATALADPEIQATRFDAILNFDRRSELPRIDIPTMVVCADDDILTPKYFSEEYVRLIPGARHHWEARGGHALSRTEPDTFNRIAIDFFTGLHS